MYFDNKFNITKNALGEKTERPPVWFLHQREENCQFVNIL